MHGIRVYQSEDIEVRGTLDVTRDKTGNPLTWGNDDYKKGYAYDDNNRLKSADYPGKSTVNWGYDWVGNRLDTGFTYNAADQLTASPGKSYTYDGNGNMLTGTMSFSYTYTNLVATAGNTSMGWDSMGNRVSFTTSGSAVYQFVYDPTAGIPAVLEEVTPGGSVFYVREPSGTLIARLTGQNLTPAYYHFDELGSTLFLTDPDDILTDKYTYDPWGNVTSHTGSTSQPYHYVGQLGYYNHYQESGFKLMQLGVRLYDPEMGRFTSRDPVEDGINWYAYVSNDCTLQTDPSGLFSGGNGCAGTHVYDWLKVVDQTLRKPACQAVLRRQGLDTCVLERLKGLIVNCGSAGGNAGETNPCPPHDITINTTVNGSGPRTLIHEAVHACRFKLGLWTPDKTPGYWPCSCHLEWGDRKKKKPYPYISEEKIAEGVVHQCGLL